MWWDGPCRKEKEKKENGALPKQSGSTPWAQLAGRGHCGGYLLWLINMYICSVIIGPLTIFSFLLNSLSFISMKSNHQACMYSTVCADRWSLDLSCHQGFPQGTNEECLVESLLFNLIYLGTGKKKHWWKYAVMRPSWSSRPIQMVWSQLFLV